MWPVLLSLASAASCDAPVEILLAGDVMAHASQVRAAAVPGAEGTYDFTDTFAAIRPWVQAADLAIVNLETVTAGPSVGYRGFPRFNAPDSLIDAIAAAGFDVVQTANNHILDQGVEGQRRTLDRLDAAKLAHAGTHRTQEEAAKGFVLMDVGGIQVAFLAYTYSTNGFWPADDEPWRVNWTWRRAPIAQDIARARAAGAELVIVGAHTETEYTHRPDAWFVELANHMVADGADIVMGTHPHVLQPVRRQGESLIFYSLGNLVSAQRTPGRDGGVLVTVRVGCDPVRILDHRVLPVWVDAKAADGSDRYRILPTPEGKACPTGDPDLSEEDCRHMQRFRSHAGTILGADTLSWERPDAVPPAP